ncbi:hypothetical protein J6590_099303, partial [Homalodisca vitripennis]
YSCEKTEIGLTKGQELQNVLHQRRDACLKRGQRSLCSLCKPLSDSDTIQIYECRSATDQVYCPCVQGMFFTNSPCPSNEDPNQRGRGVNILLSATPLQSASD